MPRGRFTGFILRDGDNLLIRARIYTACFFSFNASRTFGAILVP